jgi:molybdopterin synthase sulfur carrier subunit
VTRVRIPPTLREQVNGEREVAAEGDTVRDLLEDLIGRFPALRTQIVEDGDLAPFVNVYVEGEDVRTRDGIDTEVRPGSTVILLPAMAGGSVDELVDSAGGTSRFPRTPSTGPLRGRALRAGG